MSKPAKARVRGGPAIGILFEARDRSVVDDFSLFIAPAAVDDLSDLHFVDVARDDAIDEFGGVLAGDEVLVKWRDVDERARIANSVVLVLMMHFINADRVISGPLAVIQAMA